MRRSEINVAIRTAKDALRGQGFLLPPFAEWTPSKWHAAGPECDRIRINGLGWDVTDFGGSAFDSFGAVLFTLRNGNHRQPDLGTPYAEKAIILKPGQRLPLHLHWSKTEDIINRGGGILAMQLYPPRADTEVDMQSPVTVYCDGVERTVAAGEAFEIQPGASVTLTARLYHRFWACREGGILICGEVSSVNDDQTDNYFGEPTTRFARIEEDEPPVHLLSSEYPQPQGGGRVMVRSLTSVWTNVDR